MKEIKIQFTRPASGFKPISWIIRKLMRTQYSHVLVRWSAAKGRLDLVWEAAGSAIRFLGPIAHKGRYAVVQEYSVSVTFEEYRRLIYYTHKYAYVRYGKLQLIGMLLSTVFGLSKNPISKGESEQVCSEAVVGLLRYVKGWDIDINMDVKGPDKLKEWLDKRADK